MYKSALAYAEIMRWAVFPLHTIIDGRCTCSNNECKSPGKHPRVAGGFKSANTDKHLINEWWTRWPNANIGIVTGKVNKIIVMDIDPRNRGNESFEELISIYGPLPTTTEAISGGKGRHILFKYPGPINGGKPIKPGIDIKADGGYIVAAPSLHKSGQLYEWDLKCHPLKVGLASAPEWLLNLVQEDGKVFVKRKALYWENLLRGVEEGQRNIAATQLTGYLLRRYIDPQATYEIIIMWNERNKPPLNKNELQTIVNNVAGKELSRRRRESRNDG